LLTSDGFEITRKFGIEMSDTMTPTESRGSVPHRLANLRDVGRLPVTGGGTTRTGVLYRSDAPYAGDVLESQLDPWPRLVIDLRSSWEVSALEKGGYGWSDVTTLRPVPLFDEAAPSVHRGPLEALYLRMIEDSAFQIAALVDMLMNAPEPAMIHCAAGKDRTGVAVAILLIAAGVEPHAVVADYQRTAANMQDVLDRIRSAGRDVPAYTDLPSDILATPARAIQVVIDAVQSWRGNVVGWLVDHGANGEDVARWQLRLTGRVHSAS
jgi:hypothetical protein